MSRTNHYRICEQCSNDTQCQRHEWLWSNYKHKPIREIDGRRPWKRKPRYPKFGVKKFHNPPPRWWWQEQHSRARAIYRQTIMREEDPALPKERELINLWDWY